MSSARETSCCSVVAEALGLSPLATLALRASLMILKRIMSQTKGRSLRVSITPEGVSMRVSRVRRSSSNRRKRTPCTVEVGSGYTAIPPPNSGPPPEGVSYSDQLPDGNWMP